MPDTTFTLARLERDGDAALRRYRDERDSTAPDATAAQLDAEQRVARVSGQNILAEEAVAWLLDLPALWHAADDSGRRLLTGALFEKVEVLGVKPVTIQPHAGSRCTRMVRGVRSHATTHPGSEGCRCDRHGWSGREG